jgi:hypothetical protein
MLPENGEEPTKTEATSEPRILILMPYFGRWPEWMELFLESCATNPGVEWRFFTDCGDPDCPLPENVTLEPMTLTEFLRLAEASLGITIEWHDAYKLCDLRPGYGAMFESRLLGYDYWGWGDVDVIFGDLSMWLTPSRLAHDIVSFADAHLSGHLCVLRNSERVRDWYRFLPRWDRRMERRKYTHLDEIPPAEIPDAFSVSAEYSFNTPLSPKLAWTDGTFRFPSEWYWRDGRLTNDVDGDREFPYLHFMHWKGGAWPRQCGNAQWEKLDRLVHVPRGAARRGFKITESGFFPL